MYVQGQFALERNGIQTWANTVSFYYNCPNWTKSCLLWVRERLIIRTMKIDRSQPALLNATALLRVPLKPGLVCAAPTAATAFAPSTHVRSPPSVSLTHGPAPRVWLQGDDHQPHTQVTSSEDAEPWWWVPARPAPHQLYWPALLTSGPAPNVEKQVCINYLSSFYKCVKSNPFD